MKANRLEDNRPGALKLLLNASNLLLTAGSEEDVLADMLELAGSVLVADAYAVWRETADTELWRCVAQRGLSAAYPKVVGSKGRTIPETVWAIEDVDTDPRPKFGNDVYQAEGIQSMMMTPWLLGSAERATLVFYWHSHRTFTQEDEDCALTLSNLSAAALKRMELAEQNRREKVRLSFLAEASSVLTSSLDYEATLEQVARLAVPQIADWCTVHIAERTGLKRLAVAHSDSTMVSLVEEFARRYPEEIFPDRGLDTVLRTGKPEWLPFVPDEELTSIVRDEGRLELLRQLNLSSILVVPLISHGKALGAIRLLGSDGRSFGKDDLQLAVDLGVRAGVAIENSQLHREVLEQESELRLSHAAAKMGSWSWDLEHQEIKWSDEFKVLHGVPLSEQPSYEVGSQLVYADDRERIQRELSLALETPEVESIVFEHRANGVGGKVIWVQNRGRIRRDETGKAVGIVGIAIDVTESHMAEEALRRTEKLAAAGRLAATVAHEVNNPLESLMNLVYLSLQSKGLPEDVRGLLVIADGELTRMAHIVRQTLGFYRESTLAKAADLNKIVEDVIGLYRSRAMSRGLTLELQTFDAEPMLCLVNVGEMMQLVSNLVSNALDATPRGGRVVARVNCTQDGVELSVSDTGVGIAEEHRKHLFEPFFTTKADVGTGLGLWVSKGIVEKHGGTIVIEHGLEAGTIVRVVLPRLPEDGTQNDEAMAANVAS
jgi:PAS domain S-box-containing protein